MTVAWPPAVSSRRFAALVALGLLASCAAPSEDTTSAKSDLVADTTTLTGADIVRGVLGIKRGSAKPASREGATYADAADAVVVEIEERFPGRLQIIGEELSSRDPERVAAGKALLDEAIRAATFSPKVLSKLRSAGPAGVSATSWSRVRPLAAPVIDDEAPAECGEPGAAALTIGKVDGRYGDERTGAIGAAKDSADLVDTTSLLIWRTLQRIDAGELTPDPESRLGAYAATRGYPPGTVGEAVHNATGTIYLTFANYGQEKIGRVFNAPEAQALYREPVTSCAGRRMATIEHSYWSNVAAEDGWSPGGKMGSMFSPYVRDLLQVHVFASGVD